MAAAMETAVPELVDLRRLRFEDLNPILTEESLAWQSQLSWDFSSSAELVRRFVRIQALSGFALVIGGELAGYSYYVCEEHKALVGDLYVLRRYASHENEDALLAGVLRTLVNTPQLRRIEAQLMMKRGPLERGLPLAQYAQVNARNFMMIELDGMTPLPELPTTAAAGTHYGLWTEKRQEDAAQLIASAYRGHVDGAINDQYRSVSGAKRFLLNIIQYPGCGTFFGPGSLYAERDGRLIGLALTSLVAADVGHITQICVAPEAKGAGIGYELLRRSLVSLAAHGCTRTSLTVTAANESAIRLYQSVGFRAVRRFGAYVWEGF